MVNARNTLRSVITSLPTREFSPYELVEGVKARDDQICAAFFEQYAGQINRLVKRFLGPDQDHVDVVNNTFVQILSSIGKLRDPQALTRWVSTVTIQTVKREIRSRRYRRSLLFFTDKPEDCAPKQVGDERGLSRQLFRVLRKFPPEEYTHFVLYYLESNTYEEIAELTECSLSTAKRRGKACWTRFMACLEADEMLANVIEEWKHA